MDLSVLGGLAETVLREGFIYSLMAMGVFITYKILDFPDLTTDGTFPLGSAVAAVMISAGANPWLACLCAMLAGAAAGAVTGLLHVKLGITDLLSGILVMTALWSVNLVLMGGSITMQFFNKPTIFNSGLAALIPAGLGKVVMAFLLVLILKLVLDWFLGTKRGLLLRATGNNSAYVTGLGRDPGAMKIFGLALGNACTALAGCVLAQLTENADGNGGRGMVVLALAAVIIGANVFGKIRFLKATTLAILGAILYKTCLQAALLLGLPTMLLKALMAALLTVAIVSGSLTKGGRAHG